MLSLVPRDTQSAPACEPAVTPLAVGPQVDVPVALPPVRTSLLTHLLRHAAFAEYTCSHCARSYERAMVRYAD